MSVEEIRAAETRAMQRVVTATLGVQSAFAALQKQFPPEGDGRPSGFALNAFDAALQELENAQQAFDEALNSMLDGLG